MKGIKEILTALSNEESTAVWVIKKEKKPMSDERFRLVLECIVLVTFIISWTVLALNADPEDLILLIALAGVAGIIYAGMKIK